jgi:hypothetical protein
MRCCCRIIGQLTLAFSAAAGCSPPGEPAAAPQEQHFSFKDLSAKPDGFELFGPEAENCVHFEPDGLRIQTLRDFPSNHPSTGLTHNTVAKGDFEITTDFEILHEPEPTEVEKDGARFTLDVVLEDNERLAALSRRVGPPQQGGTQFLAFSRERDQRTNRLIDRARGFASTAKSGRLRIARKGSQLSFAEAEGAGDEFKNLQQIPFGTGDVWDLRLVAGGGGPNGWLDVRIIGMTIRADALPSSGTISSHKALWTVAGAAALLAALIVILIWHRRRLAMVGATGTAPERPAGETT